jgi:hypothetical protein
MTQEDLSHIFFSPMSVVETRILLLIYSILPMPAEHGFSKYHPPHVGTVFSESCINPAEYLLGPVIQWTHYMNTFRSNYKGCSN